MEYCTYNSCDNKLTCLFLEVTIFYMCTGEVSWSTQGAKNNTIHNLNVQHTYILYIKVIYDIIQLNTCIDVHAMLISK